MIGVIPQSLMVGEVVHPGLSGLDVVQTITAQGADAGACRRDGGDAGGFGTLEELFEVLSWRQMQLHRKACGLLIDGFDPLLDFLDADGSGIPDAAPS